MADLQWYPGHMTKARRMMEENISLVDLVIELTDARAPFSGRNPDIDTLARGKARMLLMNKADLADPVRTQQFCTAFEEQGIQCVALDARNRRMNDQIRKRVQEACREKLERNRKREILNRPLRAMVVGIPNVGKSTFINSFAGKASAKTGNKPGVTRGKQWIRLNKELELLDTPGILWPRFDDQEVGIRLALIMAIREEILNEQELAVYLLNYLKADYPEALTQRYGTPDKPLDLSKKEHELFTQIALNKQLIARGQTPDLDRACRMLLEDFRTGRLGRITLERTAGTDMEVEAEGGQAEQELQTEAAGNEEE